MPADGLRVLRVSYRTAPRPGGKEQHVDALTAAQLRAGHRITLAVRHGATTSGSAAASGRASFLSRAVRRRSDPAALALELRAVVAGTSFDLVHLHGDQIEAGMLGPACRRAGLPVVLTVHGALALRHRAWAVRAFRHIDAFVALGARPRQDLLACGVGADRVTVLSSAVDHAAVRRAGPVTRAPGLVVSVGALDPVKDHALVLRAVARLAPLMPHLRLVVVGEGPERPQLEALARGLPVSFTGQLPKHDVYRLLHQAEAFVLASRRLPGKGEGVPTAALEALACGTPAVLSSEAGLEPVVPVGSGWTTFPAGSVDGLAGVLLRVLSQPRLQAELATSGRDAVAGLTWEHVAREVQDVYDHVLVHARAEA